MHRRQCRTRLRMSAHISQTANQPTFERCGGTPLQTRVASARFNDLAMSSRACLT
jgi:hypothetical protein